MNEDSESSVLPSSGWPSWQTEPCPQWCISFHNENDDVVDRVHVSDEFQVWLFQLLHIAPPYAEGHGRHVVMYLRQHVDEDLPRLWLGIGDSGYGFAMMPYEASSVASTLNRLVILADERSRKGV